MTTGSPNGHRADTPAELTEQVAELASEISEAKTASRRQRLAGQLPELARRSREKSLRGLQSGRQAAAKRVAPARQAAARRARAGGSATARLVRLSGQWMAGQVLEMAPKVPVRSVAALRTQYPGLEPDDLALRLIDGAARASGGIGAAVGVAAAVPFIPTAPVELAVETMALVAIELKLVAELHEVYGMPAAGSVTERTVAYVGAWANRRGVRITSSGIALAIGSPMRRKLERRLIAKAGKSALALAPLMAGAAAGALVDHRETRRLGMQIRDDLRKRATDRLASSE